jgi:hypothetical protein
MIPISAEIILAAALPLSEWGWILLMAGSAAARECLTNKIHLHFPSNLQGRKKFLTIKPPRELSETNISSRISEF